MVTGLAPWTTAGKVYNVLYFAHLNSCKRTHVLDKLVLTT